MKSDLFCSVSSRERFIANISHWNQVPFRLCLVRLFYLLENAGRTLRSVVSAGLGRIQNRGKDQPMTPADTIHGSGTWPLARQFLLYQQGIVHFHVCFRKGKPKNVMVITHFAYFCLSLVRFNFRHSLNVGMLRCDLRHQLLKKKSVIQPMKSVATWAKADSWGVWRHA